MGIIDEIEKYRDDSDGDMPNPWNGSEDKLEEWMGMVPEGTMPSKKKAPKKQARRKTPEPRPVMDRLVITLDLAKEPTDIYRPNDFKGKPEAYARALARQAKRVPKGWYAGYILTFYLGKIKHTRRITEPVKDKKSAYASPEFVLAVTQAMAEITSHRQCKV